MIHCKNSSLAYDLRPHEVLTGREICDTAGQRCGPKGVQASMKVVYKH
jgi:hypothetical protein